MFRRIANSSGKLPSAAISILRLSYVLRIEDIYIKYTGLHQGLPSLCSSLPPHRRRLSSLQGLINLLLVRRFNHLAYIDVGPVVEPSNQHGLPPGAPLEAIWL